MKIATILAALVTLAPAISFADNTPSTSQSDQAAQLDVLIKQFKDARDQANARAYEAGSRATQFLGQNWVDYQQAVKKQEFYQNQVKLLDEKIAELEKQKAALKK